MTQSEHGNEKFTHDLSILHRLELRDRAILLWLELRDRSILHRLEIRWVGLRVLSTLRGCHAADAPSVIAHERFGAVPF